MEEIYNGIVNGEINIKYLSPIDLLNLELYLKKKNISLNSLLDKQKDNNNKLNIIKEELKSKVDIIDNNQ